MRTPRLILSLLVSLMWLGLSGPSQAQFNIGLYRNGQLIDTFTNAPAPAATLTQAKAAAGSKTTPQFSGPVVSDETRLRNQTLAQAAQPAVEIKDHLRQMQQPEGRSPGADNQRLASLMQQFLVRQDQARATMIATRNRLVQLQLDPIILQRQLDTMAAFEIGLFDFTNAVNAVLAGQPGALDQGQAVMERLRFRQEPDLSKATPTRVPMQIRPAPVLMREEADARLRVRPLGPAETGPRRGRTDAVVPGDVNPVRGSPQSTPGPVVRPNSRNLDATAPRTGSPAESAQRPSRPDGPRNEVTRTGPLTDAQTSASESAAPAEAFPPPAIPEAASQGQPQEFDPPIEFWGSPPVAADLVATLDIQLTTEITNQAVALGNSPLAIYEFVRNNCAFQPYLGSRKGSVFTLRQRAGNDTDQASLLLALLRAAGIPCRYVRGTVEMTPQQAMDWLGVEDAHTAGSILTTAGLDGLNIVDGGGNVTAIRCTRVWVEAYVPYSNYRGIPNDDTGKTWIPLDPAFKGNTVHPGEDVLTAMAFNTDAFLADYISTFHAQSPLEKLNADVQTWLNVNRPGQAVADIERTLALSQFNLGLLPASLPYQMLSVSSRFSGLESTKRYQVRFHLYNGGTTFIDYTISLPELITKRLTIDYIGATPADQATIDAHGGIYQTPPNLVNVKPRLKLDGTAVVTSANASGMGYSHSWDMHFTQPVGDNNEQPVVSNQITAGNGQSVAFDTFLDVPLGFLAGGSSSAGSLLDSTLYETAAEYLSRVDHGEEQASRLMHMVTTVDVSEAIVENSVKVTFSFGTPVTFEWTGLIVDADRRIIGPFAVNGSSASKVPYMKLTGYDASNLENRVFEDMYAQEAISTIKILELANDAGIGVCTITSSIGGQCPGINQPSSVINAINTALGQGHHVIVPRGPITVGQWSGTGYIDLDPDTGAAGYIISGGISGNIAVSGGATVDVWDINLGCAAIPPLTGTITPNGFSSGATLCADNSQISYTVTMQYNCKDADGNIVPKTFGPTSHAVPMTKRDIVKNYGPGQYTISIPGTSVSPVNFTLVYVEFSKDEEMVCCQAGGTFDAKTLLSTDSTKDASLLNWTISPNSLGASISPDGVVSFGTAAGSVTVAASAASGACSDSFTLAPTKIELVVENNLTECMEKRSLTFTATAIGPSSGPMTFTFHYKKADGTPWTDSDWSLDLVEDNTVVADDVPDGDPDHKFTSPIYVSANVGGADCASANLNIDVYELWIEYFRDAASAKDWKAIVGENIAYKAIASSDCTSWAWDMQDGFFDQWNPSGGNMKQGIAVVIPNSDLPTDSHWNYFGETYGTVDLFCEDGEGNNHHIYSTSMTPPMKAKVFFQKDATTNPGGAQPNWFYYWKRILPWGRIGTLNYNAGLGGYASTDPSGRVTTVSSLAGQHNDETGHRGIHTFYETLAHESYHITLWEGWWGVGGSPVAANDTDHDTYPDSWESTDPAAIAAGFVVGTDDNYNLGAGHPGYDYEEAQCRAVEHALNSSAYDSSDWSFDPTGANQGKQW